MRAMTIRFAHLPCALLFLVAGSRFAAAEPRAHDGFYLRLGAGGGYALGTLSVPAPADSDSGGPNVATEVAVGLTVRRGLILGVGAFPMVAPAPDYDGVDAGGQHVSSVGAFADYYLNPAGGLHLQAGVLFAAGYLDGSDTRDGIFGLGYGGMAGVGYDMFVGDEWSLGGLVRLTAYRLFGVDDRIRLLSPSLLFTATFN
jgi:hypothetical protein